MKAEKIILGTFKELYIFFDQKFGEKYSVSMEYDTNKGDFLGIGAPCIQITKNDFESIIKIFDPTYYAPSSKDSVIVEIIMHDQDYDPTKKPILLSRFDEPGFDTIAEKILECVLISVNEDDEDAQRQTRNIINQFEVWSNDL